MHFAAFVYMAMLAAGGGEPAAFFQAHRGGLDEVPENTLAAMRHAWAVPGAVPEVDVRTTSDGVLVCIHDETAARTTNAPEAQRDTPISALSYAALAQWDAGAWFDAKYAGERVPTLRAVFELMAEDGARQIYLDLKGVDLDALRALIDEFGFFERVIFVHGDPAMCAELQARFPGARTMTWISGLPAGAKRRFEELAQDQFKGISQLQFHLRPRKIKPEIVYMLDDAYLAEACRRAQDAGVALQVRPFVFDGPSLRRLLDMGIRWFVADAPARFAEALEEAAALEPGE